MDVQYARSGGAAIAYRVVGDGPVDVVLVSDFMSNLVYDWESPLWRPFYERVASFCRLVLFDKRGTGISDHTGGFPTLETRMEDLRAVLDAVGSTRTAVLGAQEGCGMASLFAATYPERTTALLLFQPAVSGAAYTPGWPHVSVEQRERELAVLADERERWGTREFFDERLADIAPSLYASEDMREWFSNYCRVCASPAAAYALLRAYYETDLREVLPAVRVPTLLMFHGEMTRPLTEEVASLIADSQVVRIPGDDFWGIFSSSEIPVEIERFVSGPRSEPEQDRVLVTLLFTDLVGSTERAIELGDRAWQSVLRQHHNAVRQELGRQRGREVDTAGDGFFAAFEGPARAIRCAEAIKNRLSVLSLPVRIGIHTGECEVVDQKPTGIAVHIASRVASAGNAGDILVTSAVRDLVAGSGIRFTNRGAHSLKGLNQEVQLYVVDQA